MFIFLNISRVEFKINAVYHILILQGCPKKIRLSRKRSSRKLSSRKRSSRKQCSRKQSSRKLSSRKQSTVIADKLLLFQDLDIICVKT